MNEHIAFLQSLIMTTKLIDKKYSDGVPACVSLIDVHDQSADDANQSSEKTKKRKSNKRMKFGKDGLYPTEDSFIRRWWASLDDDAESGTPGVSREDRIKSRISQLRVRETQLQMIVILEALALQPLSSTLEDLGGGLPAALPSAADPNGKDKSAKPKKLDNLIMLIDVHIDRLCIWQDIAIEGTNSARRDVQNRNANSSDLPRHTDNILRDFCVEVIGPL